MLVVRGIPFLKNPVMVRNENTTGAPNDRFLGNICSEPSRTAKIFESPRTAKNFEKCFVVTVRWAQSFGICAGCSPKNFGFCSNIQGYWL